MRLSDVRENLIGAYQSVGLVLVLVRKQAVVGWPIPSMLTVRLLSR